LVVFVIGDVASIRDVCHPRVRLDDRAAFLGDLPRFEPFRERFVASRGGARAYRGPQEAARCHLV